MADDLHHSENHLEAGSDDDGERLDRFLVRHFPDLSRSHLARQIREGNVEVNGRSGGRVRPGLRLETGDRVTTRLVERSEPVATPEPIDLSILYEDDSLIALDKPPGLTVHPGAGQLSGTLANALAHHFATLSEVGGALRPGIVHRLDRDTSGVMLIAKSDPMHHALASQFQERTVRKEYLAVVKGVPELDADLIDVPLGAHRRHPTRRAIRLDVGKPAQTVYEVAERFERTAFLRCRPRTGRTHQIRVHLASIGHPVLGDRSYGGVVGDLVALCRRQALHARRITVRHPASGREVTFEAPLPADMEGLLAHLRAGGAPDVVRAPGAR